MAEHGRCPTMREIGNAVGLSSTSSVNYQLRRLQAQGFVTRTAQGWQPR
ncbi:LexA family protein [Streptomyces sp. NBC_00963]